MVFLPAGCERVVSLLPRQGKPLPQRADLIDGPRCRTLEAGRAGARSISMESKRGSKSLFCRVSNRKSLQLLLITLYERCCRANQAPPAIRMAPEMRLTSRIRVAVSTSRARRRRQIGRAHV